jgi:hypothetical protein
MSVAHRLLTAPPMNRLFFALVVIAGCESGNSIVVDLTVPDALATSFSASSPAVLRMSTSFGVESYAPLCGSTLARPFTAVKDLGFGCLSDVGHSTEQLQAWVEPLPGGWDKTAFCALTSQRDGIDLGKAAPKGADGGVDDSLAAQPDASWHQAQATVTWGRDGSACGGIAKGSLSLQ